MKKPFTLAAVAVFSIVALVQLLRLLMGWEVTIEGFAVPLWASGVAVVVAAGLAVTVWREREMSQNSADKRELQIRQPVI